MWIRKQLLLLLADLTLAMVIFGTANQNIKSIIQLFGRAFRIEWVFNSLSPLSISNWITKSPTQKAFELANLVLFPKFNGIGHLNLQSTIFEICLQNSYFHSRIRE